MRSCFAKRPIGKSGNAFPHPWPLVLFGKCETPPEKAKKGKPSMSWGGDISWQSRKKAESSLQCPIWEGKQAQWKPPTGRRDVVTVGLRCAGFRGRGCSCQGLQIHYTPVTPPTHPATCLKHAPLQMTAPKEKTGPMQNKLNYWLHDIW